MPRPRTDEDRAYHARKEREYRAKKKVDRDVALARFVSASSALMRDHRYTPGALVDLMLRALDD